MLARVGEHRNWKPECVPASRQNAVRAQPRRDATWSATAGSQNLKRGEPLPRAGTTLCQKSLTFTSCPPWGTSDHAKSPECQQEGSSFWQGGQCDAKSSVGCQCKAGLGGQVHPFYLGGLGHYLTSLDLVSLVHKGARGGILGTIMCKPIWYLIETNSSQPLPLDPRIMSINKLGAVCTCRALGSIPSTAKKQKIFFLIKTLASGARMPGFGSVSSGFFLFPLHMLLSSLCLSLPCEIRV